MSTNDITQVHYPLKPKPNCARCKESITDAVVTAQGKTYHPEHYTCAVCDKPVTEATSRLRGGTPFCEADYVKLFAKSCYACGEPIMDTVLTAMGESWHNKCFRCANCKEVIGQLEYNEKDRNPLCMNCGRTKLISKFKYTESEYTM